jgi:photosystem II stability/assembly factor-like uncharacterized protein
MTLDSAAKLSVSGRVSSIAIHPNNPKHILIGAAEGGIWGSSDRGLSWNPLTDHQESLAIGALAFDPRDGKFAYAGTGEGNSFQGPLSIGADHKRGAGLLRWSSENCKWQMIAKETFAGEAFFDIKVDPKDPRRVFAATTAGMFESADQGHHWSPAQVRDITWSISIHPEADEVLVATEGGVFRRSCDRWQRVMVPGLPEWPSRIAICHAPSDGDVAYIFSAGPWPDCFPQLWRRESIDHSFTPCVLPADLNSKQASYDWFAGVAPNNPDIVYLGAYDTHRGMRSVSGDWNWRNLTSKTDGDCIHADQHAIAFDPTDSGVLYIGCDGGIFRSEDEGTHWESLNSGLCITEFEFVSQHPTDDAWLLAGTQDNGTLRYEGCVWRQSAWGDGGDCGLNLQQPNICYSSEYGMGLYRSTTGGGWTGWEWIGPDVEPDQNQPDGALFYPPMAVCGNLVAQAGTTVFLRAESFGTTPKSPWIRVALPAGERASALVFRDLNSIFVGTDRGSIYRIENRDGLWGAPVQIRAANGVVSDLHFTPGSPGNPSRLWAAYSTGEDRLIRSDNPNDDQVAWVPLSQQIPPEFAQTAINAIEVDASQPNVAYIGLDTGVLRATGATTSTPQWELFSNGLPNALVKELTLHSQSRLLRAATQSRGMWEIDLDNNPAKAPALYISQNAVDTGLARPTASNIDDPFLTPGSSLFWWQSPDIKADYSPFQTESTAAVDGENFADDRGVGASGLRHVNPRRGSKARLYVRLRTRQVSAPADTTVRLYYTAASLACPDLPESFWEGAPIPSTSPWRVVVPEQKPSIKFVCDGSAIVSLDWIVPDEAPSIFCFLAIASGPDGKSMESKLRIRDLLKVSTSCAVSNLAILNPPVRLGPLVRSLPLIVRGELDQADLSVVADQATGRMVNGFLVSKGLSDAAAKRGLPLLLPDDATRAHLVKLRDSAELGATMDWEHIYVPEDEEWLRGLDLSPQATEYLLLLPKLDTDPGHASIYLRCGESVLGGFTFQHDEWL